mgnify:CR=1 FL=1
MLCPKCHSEYLDHLKECGDCKTDLISASPIDLPIPEMMWSPLIPFDGKIYADMAAESAVLAKSQVLQQSAMAMIAQASRAQQSILTLLQGM